MKERINGALFKQMVLFGAACINLEKQSINDLNVFPVPDGDTGTNMSLTVGNAASELRKRDFASLSDAADCTSSGLLRGARGNSGVITSLLFRGMSSDTMRLFLSPAGARPEATHMARPSATAVLPTQ